MTRKVCMFVWNNLINDARVKREASALAEEGYDVTVICTKDDNTLKEEIIEGFKVKRVNASSTLQVIINMIRKGSNEEFDVYHSNDLKTLPQGYICSKILKNKKLIYDAHEVETSRTGHKGKIKYYFEKFLVGKVDKMIMTTDTRAEYNSELYKIKKPEVIHNYPFIKEIDYSKFNLYQIANIPFNEPILLYQGGLQPGRGLENIVGAIPKFKKGITVFIGDGKSKDKIKAMVKERGIQDKVRFLDTVPSEDLMYYTQHAYLGFQVLQNTSFNHYSALSNKLLEYTMMEVPVIASDFPEMSKVINKYKVGISIDSHVYDNISDAVNYLLDNPEKYMELKQNCSYAKEILNWNREKKRLLNVYESLLLSYL